jgi:hypothetical protein
MIRSIWRNNFRRRIIDNSPGRNTQRIYDAPIGMPVSSHPAFVSDVTCSLGSTLEGLELSNRNRSNDLDEIWARL